MDDQEKLQLLKSKRNEYARTYRLKNKELCNKKSLDYYHKNIEDDRYKKYIYDNAKIIRDNKTDKKPRGRPSTKKWLV